MAFYGVPCQRKEMRKICANEYVIEAGIIGAKFVENDNATVNGLRGHKAKEGM